VFGVQYGMKADVKGVFQHAGVCLQRHSALERSTVWSLGAIRLTFELFHKQCPTGRPAQVMLLWVISELNFRLTASYEVRKAMVQPLGAYNEFGCINLFAAFTGRRKNTRVCRTRILAPAAS
jgi:hypothetical protein